MAAAWDDVVTDNVTIDTAENHNARTTEIKRKVQGPDASTEGMVAKWDGTTGRVLKDSLAFVSDDGGIYIPLGQHFNEGGFEHVHAVPKLDDCAAPDDNTDLNATTSAHGLLKKLPGDNTQYMNGAGNWSVPSGSGGTTDHAALSHLAYVDAGHTGFEPAIGAKGTAFNKNYGATATDVKINGTQAVGTTDAIARIDHVHPTDTGRFRTEGIYNVKDSPYNASGNGVADDTTAIQSAIDAAEAAGGGIVFFPAGTYIISSTLTITEPVSLVGEGSDRTDFEAGAFTNYATTPSANTSVRSFDTGRSISLIRWSGGAARGTMVRVMKTGTGGAASTHYAIGGMFWHDLAFDSTVFTYNGVGICLDFDMVQKSVFSNIKIAYIPGTAVRLYPRHKLSGNPSQNCDFNHFDNIHIDYCMRGFLLDATIEGTMNSTTGVWSGLSFYGNCCNNVFTNIGIRFSGGEMVYDGYSGKATGGDATTLVDTGASWTTNSFKNCIVYIKGGTGQGSWAVVQSNTSNTLTVSDWLTVDGSAGGTDPAADSQYTIDCGNYGIKLLSADSNAFYQVWSEGWIYKANPLLGAHTVVFAGGNATWGNEFHHIYGCIHATKGTSNRIYGFHLDTTTLTNYPIADAYATLFWEKDWGTWTPSLTWTGGTPSSLITVARYNRIGNIVNFDIHISSEDSKAASNLTITLPFAPVNTAETRLIPVSAFERAGSGGVTYYSLIACIVADGSSNKINFLNFTTGTDGQHISIHASGSYECL